MFWLTRSRGVVSKPVTPLEVLPDPTAQSRELLPFESSTFHGAHGVWAVRSPSAASLR
jgi:hypothetical protein